VVIEHAPTQPLTNWISEEDTPVIPVSAAQVARVHASKRRRTARSFYKSPKQSRTGSRMIRRRHASRISRPGRLTDVSLDWGYMNSLVSFVGRACCACADLLTVQLICTGSNAHRYTTIHHVLWRECVISSWLLPILLRSCRWDKQDPTESRLLYWFCTWRILFKKTLQQWLGVSDSEHSYQISLRTKNGLRWLVLCLDSGLLKLKSILVINVTL